jgi:hypothetical protein
MVLCISVEKPLHCYADTALGKNLEGKWQSLKKRKGVI